MLRTMLCLAAAAFVAQSLPARADDGSAVVADLAMKAIARGHGKTCSLRMEPVRSGGYYPCLDFGPYRVVKEYGRITGFVVREGSAPFPVMSHGERGQGFVDGPWVTDMPARIVTFWADVVDGGLGRAKASNDARRDRQSAEDYVRSLNEPPSPEPKPAADRPQEAPAVVRGGEGGDVINALTADQRPN